MRKYILVLTERELDMLDKYFELVDVEYEDVQACADIREKVYAVQQEGLDS
jgi:hypothetical protein